MFHVAVNSTDNSAESFINYVTVNPCANSVYQVLSPPIKRPGYEDRR